MRLLCLRMTMLTVAGVTTVGRDVVADQCGGRHDGVEDRWWRWPLTKLGFAGHPAQHLVLGAAGPLLLLAVLWYLGRRTVRRYESITPPDAVAEAAGSLLLRPSTWDGEARVTREQWAHLAAGLALTAVMVALAAAALATQNG